MRWDRYFEPADRIDQVVFGLVLLAAAGFLGYFGIKGAISCRSLRSAGLRDRYLERSWRRVSESPPPYRMACRARPHTQHVPSLRRSRSCCRVRVVPQPHGCPSRLALERSRASDGNRSCRCRGCSPLVAAHTRAVARAQRMPPNKRLKLAARVDYGMNLSSARRSSSAIR